MNLIRSPTVPPNSLKLAEINQLPKKQKYNRKKKVLKQVNKELKEIATLIGLEGLKLTTYVSRHSYATTLKNGNVPTAQISEALGHSTEKTTQTYLKSFDKDVLDEIDERVL